MTKLTKKEIEAIKKMVGIWYGIKELLITLLVLMLIILVLFLTGFGLGQLIHSSYDTSVKVGIIFTSLAIFIIRIMANEVDKK